MNSVKKSIEDSLREKLEDKGHPKYIKQFQNLLVNTGLTTLDEKFNKGLS